MLGESQQALWCG